MKLTALLFVFRFAFLTPLPAAEPPKLHVAARAGDREAIHSLLAGGADVNARDDAGNTPLMVAAMCADAETVNTLLKAGADVKAKNKAGATALLRAATFPARAELLLTAGADVAVQSESGNSALMLAARKPGNSALVKRLLERGADVNAKNGLGATALMGAVAAGDADSVNLLLDKGADVNAAPAMSGEGFIFGGGRTPLMWAAFRGDVDLVKLLLARGAKVDAFTLAGTALSHAAWGGHATTAKLLLDAGAPVDQRDLIANYTPLHWAASSERLDASLVELLIAHRADVNAEGGQPVDAFLGATKTPLQLARKRGDTPIVQALLKAGAREGAAEEPKQLPPPARTLDGPADDAAIAAAIQKALPPLQRTAEFSAASFRKHATRQSCVSCHQQDLPLSAMSLARSRGFAVAEPVARQTVVLMEEFAQWMLELDSQTLFHPDPAIGNGYALMALHLEKRPASPTTDAHAHQLTVIQLPDGSWEWNLPRPPIQSSAITATALAVQGLKHYAIPGRKKEFDERIARASQWLASAKAETTDERVYQILGLAWAGGEEARRRALAEELIRDQRSDGGWAQLAKLKSDAFATGLALYALQEGAALPPSHGAVKKGAAFLVRTQLADGTWFVPRRTFPFQPPMDSGFGHGADGWLSATASSWAVMSLTLALDATKVPPALLAPAKAAAETPSAAANDPAAAGVDYARDIEPVLTRSCAECHKGKRAKGGFDVTDRAAFTRGGKRGDPVIVPGQPDASPLLRYVTDQEEDLEMPPLNKRAKFAALTKQEIAALRNWIAAGAK